MLLIEIEGIDGCGKETQANLLFNKLIKKYKVKKISFPNYEDKSSSLVKMYLNGEFGYNPNNINPFIASTFFAIDRYNYFKKHNNLKDYDIIILDRYVGSNAIYQASKISNLKEKDTFLNWLFDYEYKKLKIPKPDMVFFLDVDINTSINLRINRKNKINNSDIQDIHESNNNYLKQCYENALYISKKYNWYNIDCIKNNKIKNPIEINKEILNKLFQYKKGNFIKNINEI